MGEGAVGAEEGDDAHEMQSGFPLFGGVHDLQEGLVLEEGAVGDGPVDADPVGIDPPAGADVSENFQIQKRTAVSYYRSC